MKSKLFTLFVLIAILLSGTRPAIAQDPLPPDDPESTEGLISSEDFPTNTGGDFMEAQSIGALAPGPDKFGYISAADIFSWIDVSTGTSLGLTGYGGGKGVITLPFNFKFYENTFNKLYITTFGYVSFSSSSYWDNQQSLPLPSTPNNVIAPYWTPTYVDSNAWVKYKSFGTAPNRYFVIEWHNVQGGSASDYTGSNDEYTFELILHENGDISFQYKTMIVNSGYWCGISGIEDSGGHDGLYTIDFCNNAPASSTAVRFERPAPSARALPYPDYQGVFTSPGVEKTFNVLLRNTGEFGTDTFDLIKSASWSLKLYNSNGALLTDTDQDGKIDTGPIPQGGTYSIIAKIKTPNGAIAGNYVDGLVQARSSIDTSKGSDIHLQLVVPAPFAQAYIDFSDGNMSIDLNLPEEQKRVNTATGSYGSQPSVAASPVNGNFVNVWNDYRYMNGVGIRDLYYSIIGPDGGIQRPALRLTDHAGASNSTYDYEPSLTVAPNGRTGIIWRGLVYDTSGNMNSNVFFAILDITGNLAYGPVNLTNNDVWGTNNSLGVPAFYSLGISATTDNHFVMTWQRTTKESGGMVDDVYYGVVNSSGTHLRAVTKLTNDTQGQSGHIQPRTSLLRSKRMILTWINRIDGNDDLNYAILDSNGNVYKSATNLSVDESVVDWDNGDVTELSDGRIMVAWTAWGCFPGEWKPRIRYSVLNSSYNQISSPTCLETLYTKNNGDSGISITADKNSRAIFTWLDRDGLNLYYALLANDGSVVSPALLYKTSSDPEDPYIDISYNGFGNAPYTIYKPKKPVIIVHGWQGQSLTGRHCSEGIQPYEKMEQSNNSTLGELPEWFDQQGYQVWIAHIESSTILTPALEGNAYCLKNQIEQVSSVNTEPITIVAHSMGGVVSRAAIRYLDPSVKVDALYTLGSPHAGIPSDILFFLFPGTTDLCVLQPGACQMSVLNMNTSYNLFNQNIAGRKYYFIGGAGNPLPYNYLMHPLQGDNDGLVGKYSAIGLEYVTKNFLPVDWSNNTLNGHQFWTNETHVDSWGDSYYDKPEIPGDQTTSDSFKCITDLMVDGDLDSQQYCQTVDMSNLSILEEGMVESQAANATAFTDLKSGHLDTGQSVSVPLIIDTSTTTLFYLTWSGETPAFTLTRPDAQVIDPAYATAYPLDVSFDSLPGSAEFPPYMTYNFTTTQPGTWQLNITASGAVDYQAFATLDSSRSLTADTDSDTYQIGNLATITANITSSGIGLTGAAVTATIKRADSVGDTLPLVDQGDGSYTATYTIPNAPGYLSIDVTASGTDNGTQYTRQTNTLASIKSNNLQMTGSYSDQLVDTDVDGMYDALQFSMGVNLAEAGKYSVTSELYSGTQLVSQAGEFFDLTSGVQTIQLSFNGTDIRESGLDGPYTVTHLYLIPETSGIPDQQLDNVWTTTAYTHTQFGKCNVLTLTHTGMGSNPASTPANSSGCPAGEFTEGEVISLTASPDLGWAVSNWSGTSNNAAGNTTEVTMPSTEHIVSTNYYQLCFSLNTSVAPLGSGLINKNPLPNCNNGTGYTYGTDVELTALSNTGYAFNNWEGGAAGVLNPVMVAMIEEKSVTAKYLTIGIPRPPLLLFPASGAVTTDYTPTLDWGESSPIPDHYRFQFASSSAFGVSSLLYDQEIISSTFEIPTDLPPGKTYYWRVRGVNSLGTSGNWSTVRNVRTGWLPPSLIAPLEATHELTLHPFFDWSDVTGAAGYTIQISKNTLFTQIVHTGNSVDSSYVPATDLPKVNGAPLYWRVQTKGVNGPSAWTNYRSFISPVPTSAPGLLLPASNALVTNYQPTFTWTAVVPPIGITLQHYIIQVDDNANFLSPVIEETSLIPNYPTASELASNTQFYWRVRTVNTVGEMSNWSAARSFRAAILAPTLVSPVDAFASMELRPLFTWSTPSGPGTITGYTIQVSRNSAFTQIVHTGNSIGTSYVPTADLPKGNGTPLYWRVLAKGPNGPSLYSDYRSFTTPANPPPTPALAAPASNALVTNYNPTFTWKSVVMPVGTPAGITLQNYILQVDESSDFSSPVIDDSSAVTPDFTPTDALATNIKYYWRVRAVNSLGQMSNWSSVWYFRSAVLVPTLVAPNDEFTSMELRPFFDWEAPAGPGAITGYTIQISRNNIFTQVVHTGNPIGSSYAPTTDLPKNATLYWRVLTKGIYGPSLYSSYRSVTTPIYPPPTPALLQPASNALVTNDKPTFTWKPVSMPVGTPVGITIQNYIIQVDENFDFSSPVINNSSAVAPTFTPTEALATNIKYYWRVRAVNTTGEMSNWSPVWNFRSAILPPTLTSPVDNSISISRIPLLNWSDVSENAGYTLQVWKAGTTPVLVKTVTLTTNVSQYQFITTLLPNTAYFWKVQTKGVNGPSLWSDSFDFTTGP